MPKLSDIRKALERSSSASEAEAGGAEAAAAQALKAFQGSVTNSAMLSVKNAMATRDAEQDRRLASSLRSQFESERRKTSYGAFEALEEAVRDMESQLQEGEVLLVVCESAIGPILAANFGCYPPHLVLVDGVLMDDGQSPCRALIHMNCLSAAMVIQKTSAPSKPKRIGFWLSEAANADGPAGIED